MGAPNDDELEDSLIADALAAYEAECAGGATPPDVDAFCARWPQAGPALRAALAMHRSMIELDRADTPPVPLPAQLGRYQIVSEIGRGGMAPVFQARDESLGRDVALKVLLPDPVQGAGRRTRFVREARALARIRHPHVVPIYDVGADGPYAYFAMELCARSLADEPLPPPPDRDARVARLGIEAAMGLAHAHALGILHRDVKPSNLLLAGDGQVRVADFGLARLADDVSLTATGEVVGTLRYAAPEQLRGGALTPATDVYGLGATLWHLATGAGTDRPADAEEDPMVGGLSRPLRAVLLRATREDPGERYPNMDELVADLRAAAEGRFPRRARRRRALIAGIAALVAAAGATAAMTLGRSPAPERATGWIVWEGDARELTVAEPLRALRDVGVAAPLPDGTGEAWTSGMYHARIEGRLLVLRREGRPIAQVHLLPDMVPDPSRSRLAPPFDADGDGAPETAVVGEGRILIVKWAPSALGLAGAWRVPADHGISYGSPALADWDGDGRTEILLADAGTDRDGLVEERASFYAFDPETGRRLRAQALDGASRSTPQFLHDAAGRVRETYLDLEPTRSGRHPGGLWRLSPTAAPERIPVEGAGSTLTWPLFSDVDRDGEAEILIGGVAGRLLCLRRDGRSPPLWIFDDEGPLSYPILSEQDGEPGDEVCFSSARRFHCLRTAPGLSPADRVAWSVPLAAGCIARPAELGDLDGDGRVDFACGSARGGTAVWLISGASERPIAIDLPPVALPTEIGVNPFFAARLLAVKDGSATILVGATTSGWVVAWRVTGAHDVSILWTHRAVAPIIASPIRAGDGVVVADYRGWLVLLGLRDGVPRWAYRAEHAVGGTPVLLEEPQGRALVFADSLHVHRVPLPREPQPPK